MADMQKMLPQHPQARAAKKIDGSNRLSAATRVVYLDADQVTEADHKFFRDSFSVQKPEGEDGRKILFGDLHGHTTLSDGFVDPEYFFDVMEKRVDFCALTDHDHGGPWNDTLYTDKWKKVQEMVASRYRPGTFTTILGYERDSYPWYDNMIIYFSDHKHVPLDCKVRGETDAEELAGWLSREDVFIAPHDTTALTCSTDFTRRPRELMPHGFEMISRGDCAEYFDHPLNVLSSMRGGSLQDALAAGAHLAVIAGGDHHDGAGALDLPELGFPKRYPGMTAVWAKENTVEGIFEALRSRHTYAFMGPERIYVDFRVNDQRMGSCMTEAAEAPARRIFFSVKSSVPPAKVTVVKNNQDYFVTRGERIDCCSFVDYERELPEDWYYLRVTLADGRQAWTSPCWVKAEEG